MYWPIRNRYKCLNCGGRPSPDLVPTYRPADLSAFLRAPPTPALSRPQHFYISTRHPGSTPQKTATVLHVCGSCRIHPSAGRYSSTFLHLSHDPPPDAAPSRCARPVVRSPETQGPQRPERSPESIPLFTVVQEKVHVEMTQKLQVRLPPKRPAARTRV